MKNISEKCYSKNEDDWKVQDLNEFLSDLEDNDELVVGRTFCAGEPAYVLVPVEPTPRMLESVGTMEGWDGNAGEADENHIDWYQAMISAAQEAE